MSTKNWYRGRIALTIAGVICLVSGFSALLKSYGTYISFDFLWGACLLLGALWVKRNKEVQI